MNKICIAYEVEGDTMKKLAIICASVLLATTLTGCGEKTDTEQEAYRQYGINCLENGDYDDAVEAFQKALDQAVGVGAVEIDTCLYKAQAQYMAGDTDVTEENRKVKCDVAFVPVGGTYTMDFKEAAQLINIIKPKFAIPVHYGSVVGSKQDATDFIKLLYPTIKGIILINQ